MAETLDDLVGALMSIEDDDEKRSTSLRLPASVHHAALLATALGMDDSFTSATANALVDRIRAFARQQAFSQHFARFPEDLPSLGAVARRRVGGSDHPAAAYPQASVVDAAVAAAGEAVGADANVVEILTSDGPDMTALAAHVSARFDIRHI